MYTHWRSLVAMGSVFIAIGCAPSTPRGDVHLQPRLQRAVNDFLASHLVPGASVAVLSERGLTEAVAGVSDVDTGERVTAETGFRIASVTKMYVAATALLLVERGELDLDVHIADYGVELPGHPGFADEVTLRMLLSHTSGISQTFTADEDRHRALTAEDLARRIPAPDCEPGACWLYGDGNYVLAQLVIEQATGKPMATVFQEKVALPLSLTETRVIDAAAEDDALPAQYALVYDESDAAPIEPKQVFKQDLPRLDFTIIPTARDAARFGDALFSGDLLQPSSLANMLDTRLMDDLPCPMPCPFSYGLGVFHFDLDGRAVVGHDGGSGAAVVHSYDNDLTVAILSNGGEQDLGAFLNAVLDVVDVD